jgi:hypothetical protein
MKLEGSCHCGSVHFTVLSHQPVPYQRCYCSICRKTQGGGGYAINIAAEARSLQVKGQDAVAVYHAVMRERGTRHKASTAERHFCRLCGSALWLFSPEWPELLHPFASAIDSALPEAAAVTHIMLAYKPDWVRVQKGRGDLMFDDYPEESIAAWHERHHSEV